MRKVFCGVFLGFCLLMLFGCGAANLTPALNSQAQFSIRRGNWNFGASSSTRPNNGEFLIGAHLEQNGNTITGMLHIASSRCFKVDRDIPISGTVDQDGTANLTSLPVDHQVLHAALVGHDSSVVGNYSFTGGCSDGDEGSLNGNVVPPVSGMWNALDTEPDQPTAAVNMALAESDHANGHGVYPLSGTLAFSGSLCQVSARITSGYVAGKIVVINATTDEPSGATGSFRMEGDLAGGKAPTIVGAYSYETGACKDRAGALTFTP